MIKVERSEDASGALRSLAIRGARRQAKAFFALQRRERRQQRFEPGTALESQEIIDALVRQFGQKCAFCEVSIDEAQAGNVCHYRPAEGAIGSEGKFYPEHYWWLAYEWSNLYLACAECKRYKGHRFPVDGNRASAATGVRGTLRKHPYLLDPCRDDPTEHLVFRRNGVITSDTRRGQFTIEILNLNRPALVEARRRRAAEVLSSLESAQADLAKATSVADVNRVETELTVLIAPQGPFAGTARYQVAAWAKRLPAKSRKVLEAGPATAFDLFRQQPMRVYSEVHQRRVEKEYTKLQVIRDNYSLVRSRDTEHYYSKARLIQRIEIQNFRSIERLEIDIHPTTESAPWTMLVGENGTGKSSVLQAVALALDPSATVHARAQGSTSLRAGANTGLIRVFLSGEQMPVEVRIGRSGVERHTSPKVLLLGYGATRLLPRRPQATRTIRKTSDTANLFDPFHALTDAERWLSAQDPSTFEVAGLALKALLLLDETSEFTRNRGQVLMKRASDGRPLSQLSDGYQSVIALSVDIMRVLLSRWPDMRLAEGIVLIDELEAHLHPSWKMQMVSALRRTFPRVQFLATTHDPLCLRGLENGEVLVMKGDRAGKTWMVEDLPPVKGLRVDQLLTSEHFGLNSTVEPDVEQAFREYYELLAAPERADTARLAQLREQLSKYSVLGASPRDQLILMAVDSYVARERTMPDGGERLRLKAETVQRVKALWGSSL